MIPPVIETSRLILRPFTIDDVDAVWAYASDPEVTRYMDWSTHTSQAVTADWIQHTLNQSSPLSEHTWGIATKEDPTQIIGSIGCSAIEFKVSFGYVLNRTSWGHGYATEAATELIAQLFAIPGVKRVWAVCDCANTASANVLAKAGCIREGMLRQWSIRPNLPGAPARNDFIYARTTTDDTSAVLL